MYALKLKNAKTAVMALVSLASMGLFNVAHAAITLTDTTAELADVKTAVLAIGVAVLSIVIGIKLYKWITRAL